MTKSQIDLLFQEFFWVIEIWSIGANYYFQNPDPQNELVGVKYWVRD